MNSYRYVAQYAQYEEQCRKCYRSIRNGALTLGIVVRSYTDDVKQPEWYDFKCFFGTQRPKSVDDIYRFELLRIKDQLKVRAAIGKNAGPIAKLDDFTIEYAKSGRAMCRGCKLKISKGEVRISKKDYSTEVGMKYGGQDMWHHIYCFAQLRNELGFFEDAAKLPGFMFLNKADQKTLRAQLPNFVQLDDDNSDEDVVDTTTNVGVSPAKKMKSGPSLIEGLKEDNEKLYVAQNKQFHSIRTKLEKNLSRRECIVLLKYNNLKVPEELTDILYHLADNMTFGALLPCTVCKKNELVFEKFGYKCKGSLSEWTACTNTVKEPERREFVVPQYLKQNKFLKTYKSTLKARIVREESSSSKAEEDYWKPKVNRQAPALYEMDFVLLGDAMKDKTTLSKKIEDLGGKVITKISPTVVAVIASEDDVEKMGARMRQARDQQVYVVPENFLDEAQENAGQIPELVIKWKISDWGSEENLHSSTRGNWLKKYKAKTVVTVKEGVAVDPVSGLDRVAHVYQAGPNNKFSAVLTTTDIQTKQNDYFKIQLLEADLGHEYWLFQSWGRVGSLKRFKNVMPFYDLSFAQSKFHEVYRTKTGNSWESRDNFIKRPGLYFHSDIDFGANALEKLKEVADQEPSALSVPVQDLMRMIFDVNAMKGVMLAMEIDTAKLPLGQLSKKQIERAYSVLTELEQLLLLDNGTEAHFIDGSNRFYTFIPHSFGITDPPVLNNLEIVQQKREMLDNLLELEIASTIMKQNTDRKHELDTYYDGLHNDIEVLSRESEEFKIINEFLQNTHGSTHNTYTLQILECFTVCRKGEDKRFQPFETLHNKKLLWHGSGTTNFAGILSQGLRIAPPQAPMTGYMFGKGIYFADMVTKSANYCRVDPGPGTGLLLLSEVALGNIHERLQAESFVKPPKNSHSVKGVGRLLPDPNSTKMWNEIEVPLGKGVSVPNHNGPLIYNEYIVYDVAQVKLKFLVKVRFEPTRAGGRN